MRSGVIPIAGWGLVIGGIDLIGLLVFDLDLLPTLLLGGAALACVLWGLGYGYAERFSPRRNDARELLVEGSATTTVATAGFSLAIIGAAFAGPAFFWPGVGLFVVGIGGLVRELRASRELLGKEGS